MVYEVDGNELKLDNEISSTNYDPRNNHQMANMTYWYSCFYSKRFWQYFIMILLGNFQSNVFFRDLGRDGSRNDVRIIKCFVPTFVSYAQSKIGFKPVFIFLMSIMLAVGIANIVIESIYDRGFRDSDNITYHTLAYYLYRLSIAVS